MGAAEIRQRVSLTPYPARPSPYMRMLTSDLETLVRVFDTVMVWSG